MERRWPDGWVEFITKPVRKGKDLVVMIPQEIVERCGIKIGVPRMFIIDGSPSSERIKYNKIIHPLWKPSK